ncbi:MAG TPA: methyltransferase domain-containing protein [Sphingobium sp.]|nr:methyltransferase domain-containing protein [Sphingobium sp.]
MTAANRVSFPKLFFFKQFLGRPGMVGSVIPTSGVTIRALLDPIDWRSVTCIVEYGPGTGVFTREILRRMGPDARLIAIDTNEHFIHYLRSAIRDRRLDCVHGSAADIEAILATRNFMQADHVLSGLPFSTLPGTAAQAIMDATYRAIRPGGAFLVYQYSRFVLPFLAARFASIEQARVWRCLPPMSLFWASKAAEALFNSASCDADLAAE